MSRWARRNRFERDIQGWFANGAASGGRWLGVVGAHFSISHEMFDKVGKFDEAMGRRWGAEDLEFGLRAERGGIPIVAVEAVAYHMDHDTAGRDGDHRSAIEYLAQKHGRPELLGLWDYFEGRLPFSTLVTL
jgi:GT2 family glycosyltransferase